MKTESAPSFLEQFLPAAYWDCEPIQVAVCDDHSLFRRSLVVVLEEKHDIEVIAEADSGPEAAAVAAEVSPDVLFLDMALPPYGGVAATIQVLRAVPTCRVVLLSASERDSPEIAEAIGAGASGALVKERTPSVASHAVREAYGGRCILSRAVATELRKVLEELPEIGVSDRERVTVDELARGATLADAAVGLGTSLRVTHQCLTNVVLKLQRYWREEDVVSSFSGAKPATDTFAEVAAAVRRVVVDS